jgi:hypothetical protein
MANPNLHVDRDLDLSNASRGVWLVKVRTAVDVANSLWKIYLFIESEPRKPTKKGICVLSEECFCRKYYL